MKKYHIEKYPYLYKCFPLFTWKKCCNCNKDFYREWGWRAIAGPYRGGMGRNYYLCKTCAPIKATANKFFLNHKQIKGRPPKPTAPPPRKQIKPPIKTGGIEMEAK